MSYAPLAVGADELTVGHSDSLDHARSAGAVEQPFGPEGSALDGQPIVTLALFTDIDH